MAYRKKSWSEKLQDSKDLPKVQVIDSSMRKTWGEGTVVIPAPLEVNALMQQVPHGRLTTINELRQALARKHGSTIACPITTGIFAWIAAHASVELEPAPSSCQVPYWRTLKQKGELNTKYPGGIENLKILLSNEGHQIIQKGNRYFVQDYQSKLFQPS